MPTPRRSQYEDEGPEQQLPPDGAVSADHRNPRRRDRGVEGGPELGTIIEPTEADEMDNLVLHGTTKRDLASGLFAIQKRDELDLVWNLSKIQPMKGRCVLNFYGPPGTGKTRAARAIARQLGKRVYQVDYSAIISKYLGDTAKHLVACFQRATELQAVLFFDEADSLLSKRIDMDNSCATSINQNRNVLMQELDKFNGVVICTTNLFQNYDEALLRRIAKHIEFKLPNKAMRKALFELHLPNLDRVQADLQTIAQESDGLSGGDILNVCLNSIYAGSTSEDSAQWKVTEDMLLEQIDNVLDAKRAHASGQRTARHIGFGN